MNVDANMDLIEEQIDARNSKMKTKNSMRGRFVTCPNKVAPVERLRIVSTSTVRVDHVVHSRMEDVVPMATTSPQSTNVNKNAANFIDPNQQWSLVEQSAKVKVVV